MSKDIFIRKSGYIGHITLNRPDVLNSLTYSMILSIEKALIEWETDENIALIIIDAEGDRAFCAGGDIQILYENGFKKNFSYGQKFWADEYRLNEKIANYKKPFIAFMQGFTMGGGVGVSCHGSHRVVGETSKIAMPECSIGLVPDVGGSFLLAKLPGNIGTFLGVTGKRMKASDEMQLAATKEKAEAELMRLHPDFGDIRDSDDFHEWADEQPRWVQEALYENEDDAKSAARAIDLYKSDRNISKAKSSKNGKGAAEAVNTKNTRTKPQENEASSFLKESDVQKMSPQEYEKQSDEIMEAIRSGKFIYDISGSAR